MTPQERDVIAGIFERLKGAANQQRDPEAERFIAELVQKQPYATYALAQAVFVQEQALTNAQQTIEQLQFQLQEAQARPQQGGGFLSGLFGGGGRPAPAQNYRPQQGMPTQGMPMAGGMNNPGMNQPGMNAGPWGGAQQGGPWGQQQPQGGGFLRTAAMTAAGVAGGMVVGNMLMNAFSGGGAAHAADAAHGVMPLNQDVASALGSSAPSQPAAHEASHHEASHNEQFDSQADYGYDSGDDESYDV